MQPYPVLLINRKLSNHKKTAARGAEIPRFVMAFVDKKEFFRLVAEYVETELKGAKFVDSCEYDVNYSGYGNYDTRYSFSLFLGIGFYPYQMKTARLSGDAKLTDYLEPYSELTNKKIRMCVDDWRKSRIELPEFMNTQPELMVFKNEPIYRSIAIHFELWDYGTNSRLKAWCGNPKLSQGYQVAPFWAQRNIPLTKKHELQKVLHPQTNRVQTLSFFHKDIIGTYVETKRNFETTAAAFKFYKKYFLKVYEGIKSNLDVLNFFPVIDRSNGWPVAEVL